MTAEPLDRYRFRIVVVLMLLVVSGHVHWLPPLYATWLVALLGFASWRARDEVRPAPVWLRLPLLVATIGLLIYSAGSPIGREGGSAMLGGLIVLTKGSAIAPFIYTLF